MIRPSKTPCAANASAQRFARRHSKPVLNSIFQYEVALTQDEIAQAIGFSQYTVSNELSRNHGERGYRPSQAECLATERKSQKRTRPKVMACVIKVEVEARLRIKHNHVQISKAFALSDLKVSHETIYQHIADDRKTGGDLSLNLRINGRLRYRRRSKIGRGEKMPNRVDIEQRPSGVSRRKRYGTGRRISSRVVS